jgi:hypothetical protein
MSIWIWCGRGTHGTPSTCRACFSQAVSTAWNCGEFGSIPAPLRFSLAPWPETVGSGKLGNPCARRQRATFRANASFSSRCCGVPVPPLESRCLQASSAAAEVCFGAPVSNGGKFP